MNSHKHSFLAQLLLFFVSLLWSSFSNATEETNNIFCDFGPDALPGFDQTCIPSTAYNGQRCFYTYIPQCAKESSTASRVPLVFDIHGLGSCPQFNLYYTGWKEKADENCFVLVLPIGNTDPNIAESTCFAVPGGLQIGEDTMDDCCCTEPGTIFFSKNSEFDPSLTDDLRFLRQTAAVVVRDVPLMTSNQTSIDTKRIYFAGHSNGCMTSLSMAAVHSDLVAAVSCHAGTMLTPFAQDYIATPIWMVIGTADPLVSYNGGDNNFWWSWMYPSSETVFSLFANANQCNFTDTQIVTPAPGSNANKYSRFKGTSCKDDANVVLLALDNVGHNPYLGDSSEDVPYAIRQPVTLDTTQMGWEFMRTHSLKDVPNLDDLPIGEISTSSSYKKSVCVTFMLSIASIILVL